MLEATKCLIKILDTKEECLNHLSAKERDKSLKFLKEFEELFDGKLVEWDCNLVLIQLKAGAQPSELVYPWPISGC